MGKTREHKNLGIKCLRKSEIIATHLKMSISTVRAIFKKFKATGTVTKLSGRRPMFILPPRTVRRMIREAKKSPRITVGELLRKVASWGHQVCKTTIRRHLHANKLFGRHARKKSLSCHFTTNVSAWSLLNATWTLTGTVFYGQMKQKWSFSATNTQGGFGKRRMPKPKSNLYVCKYGGGGGFVMLWGCFPPKALETLLGYCTCHH